MGFWTSCLLLGSDLEKVSMSSRFLWRHKEKKRMKNKVCLGWCNPALCPITLWKCRHSLILILRNNNNTNSSVQEQEISYRFNTVDSYLVSPQLSLVTVTETFQLFWQYICCKAKAARFLQQSKNSLYATFRITSLLCDGKSDDKSKNIAQKIKRKHHWNNPPGSNTNITSSNPDLMYSAELHYLP